MKRFPPYMIIAVCGILFLSAGMVIITADSDPAAPTDPVDLLTLTPTDVVVVPVDPASQPVVLPTDVPPVAPVEAPVQPVELPTQVIVPTVEVAVVVQPTAVVEVVQQSAPVVVAPTGVPDAVIVVVTPVVELPNQPLGTLPPPVEQVLPTLEVPLVQPTANASVVQAMAAPVTANTQVIGQISVPLKVDFAGVTVLLTLPNGQVIQTQTDAAGNFVFANLPPGNYRVDAGFAGYLSSQAAFALTNGQVLSLPAATLVGGDTNMDNKIDLTDAALIAANFDGGAITSADLNHDGIVDIRDLTMIGAFFGQAGPTAWQS